MAFAISAFFPLGFYQGSDSGGRPESYPSPSRLYSALVSAAYFDFMILYELGGAIRMAPPRDNP